MWQTLTATIKDAEKLKKIVDKNKIVFALTHNYSSYPMLDVKQKRL